MNLPGEIASYVWFVLKAGALFFMAIYIIFAVVVVKQVKTMTETLTMNFDKYIRFAAYAHLFLAMLALLLGLALL